MTTSGCLCHDPAQAVPLTVEGPEVDGEPVGLAKAFPTLSADVRLVPRVSPDVARQLDGLCEDGVAILAGVHLPCGDTQGESLHLAGQELCLEYTPLRRDRGEIAN